MGDQENYYGKHGEPRKYDPNFKGPIHNRSCTDILCCILIVLGIIAYVAVGIVGFPMNRGLVGYTGSG
ncbi:choline transporter 2 isoform X2 [Pelobates cultripes]|uniref:Choline transporter 2 isoform X2 n=1 Tax=Pelobates cultripes TaxID=61616 RepID=A0AAD1VY57_PELCU|nr:choline transporter 2 isoform X2 [Pelobates cultripes]